MHSKSYLPYLVLSCLLMASTVELSGEEFNKGGRTSLQFLKIGVGARETALGEACIAVTQGVNAAFWNPGGLTGIRKMEATFSYSRMYADLNYMAGAFGFNLKRLGSFALSVATLDYGDIVEAGVIGQGGTYDPRITLENGKYKTFSGGDMLLGLTWARQLTDRLSLGLTAKYLSETLFTYSTSTYALDVGTYYDTGFKGLRIAMSAQNFGSKPVAWLDTSAIVTGYDIPLLFKFGASINVLDDENGVLTSGGPHQIQVSMEAVNSNDYGERYHFGAEYWFRDFVAVRAGYRQNYAEGNLAFGFGLKPQVAGLDIVIDYSFVNYEYLTPPQRFTLSLRF